MQIAVIGPSRPSEQESALAERVGQLLAERGAVLLSGREEGIMEAACKGAKEAGGTVVDGPVKVYVTAMKLFSLLGCRLNYPPESRSINEHWLGSMGFKSPQLYPSSQAVSEDPKRPS